MSNAAQEEKKVSSENGEQNGIAVSGDGSWRKRGFTSLMASFHSSAGILAKLLMSW